MSNWLDAESGERLGGFDQVEKCDLFPYHLLPLSFAGRYGEVALIEVPLLGPIHH